MERQTTIPSGALAPRRAPEPYVRAEVAAFPLTSLEAFRQSIVVLDPTLEEPRTRRLWRACESEFTQHAAGLSLDRMVTVRDNTWFKPPAGQPRVRKIRMHEYLRQLADAHLEPQYGVAELRRESETRAARGGAEPIDAVLHYRWLTFALPEDLLLSALRIEPPPERVNRLHPLLNRRWLDVGFAEIHQHGGAGWDFPLLWVGAMAALADPNLDPDALNSPGAVFERGRDLARWLLVAAITRVVLTEFLLCRSNAPVGEGLRAFVEACGDRAHGHLWRTLHRVFRSLAAPPHAGPAEPPEFEALQALYATLHPEGVRLADHPPSRCEDAWLCDPVAQRLGLHDYLQSERWLIRHALRYLEEVAACDSDFELVFWQVQRLRCLCYRHIVQRPLTAGLQWFIRFYGRPRPLREPLRRLQPEASIRISAPGWARSTTAALELRVGAPDDTIEFAVRLRSMVLSWLETKPRSSVRGGAEPELGVIVEFEKQRDAKDLWRAGRPTAFGELTYGQPSVASSTGRTRMLNAPGEAWHLRFGEFLREHGPKALVVADLLDAVPLALWLVRGVDVCSDELGVPTWVLAPLFSYVRQESAYASICLPKLERAPAMQLQTTAHVGEDFRHLMEGMRRIYECIAYLLERTGGRLGHAIALGLEPRSWAESVGAVLMPVEDRLWDLVFEWRLYTGFGVPSEFFAVAPPGRIERIQNLIADLAERMWTNGLGRASQRERHATAPRELAELHDRLHRFMVRPGRPTTRGGLRHALERGLCTLSDETMTDRALRAYLEDPELFRHGQQLVDVALDESEVAGLEAVQLALRRGVSQRGIVVEVNPTSNLLIGDILDLRCHPLLRLFPVEPDGTEPLVPIALGSDDPITFSTSLIAEYEIMFDVARAAGYSVSSVHAWLEQIRQTGFDARFTRRWFPNVTTMADSLLGKLEQFLHLPSWYTVERQCTRARQARASL